MSTYSYIGTSAMGGTITVTDGTGLTYAFADQQSLGSTKSSRKRIGPKLYFSYVKSKLNKIQTKKLRNRLQKLQSLVKNTLETGQKAAYEEFSRMLVVAIRESEAAACGYDVYVNRSDIDKFRNQVTENDDSYKNPVFFKKLEEFSRVVPAKVKKTIQSVQSKGLFDELWVLYLDYSGETIKSNKEKIREKDPILFGKFNYDSERFYFIADWVDEHCDLTLSKFVDALKENDEEYELEKIDNMSPEYLERLRKEIQERDERLKNTNSGNFRDNMAKEDLDELRRLREENAKLKEDEVHRLEDREIAIEKAIRDRANWREEASKEHGHENLIDPLPKKPWWKRWF